MPSYTQNLGLVKGETGATGPAGAAATIQVGTVTTGAAGSQAAVTNVGTANAAILNFTIPQGQQGVPGTTPSTDNFVTTNTIQTINAKKTFSSGINVASGINMTSGTFQSTGNIIPNGTNFYLGTAENKWAHSYINNVHIGGCTASYNSTDEALEFVFN